MTQRPPLRPAQYQAENEASAAARGDRIPGDRPHDFDDADTMCPNCVTPWKCNGPHLEGFTPYALVGIGLGSAWVLATDSLPDGYYLSNLRCRSPKGRWSASATLHGSDTGANYSGFGATPTDALIALAIRLRSLESQ